MFQPGFGFLTLAHGIGRAHLTYPFLYRHSSSYWVFHSAQHDAYYHYGGSIGWLPVPSN